jgi:hypothetical protein
MSSFLNRWRRRIGYRLVRPTLKARHDYVAAHIANDHQPTSYHKDWWLGQEMAIAHLVRDLRAKDEVQLPRCHVDCPHGRWV